MLRIPAGKFRMGCIPADGYQCVRGRPVREVTIPADFSMAVYETTFDEYDRFLAATGYAKSSTDDDHGWGRGRRPAINIRYRAAQAYAAWLTQETGHAYRLPSEAEWEYAARAGTETLWSWGNRIGSNRANCFGCGSPWDDIGTAPVGSFPPNPWGLHDMSGNVWEMVQDCAHDTFDGAPTDGSAWLVPQRGFLRRAVDSQGACIDRVIRGGGWGYAPRKGMRTPLATQSAARHAITLDEYSSIVGFRVVREMAPPG